MAQPSLEAGTEGLDPGAWRHVPRCLVTYAFETAVCYTSEFRNPGATPSRLYFILDALHRPVRLGPVHFSGCSWRHRMLAAPINDGSGVAAALAGMVGGRPHHRGLCWSY